jgi:flagellar operon protein
MGDNTIQDVGRINPLHAQHYVTPQQQVQAQTQAQQSVQTAEKRPTFADVMTLQFSKHANVRLNSREISLSGEQLKRVEDGVAKAGQKGVRDSLVLVDDVALVVNVGSKTVITAINRNSADKNIFTNIDGAVIV